MAKKNNGVRLVLWILLAAVVAGGGFLGWQWQATLLCREIRVQGAGHAEPDSLVALARVDTSLRLFGIEPAIIEDRVRRHPWVKEVDVTRFPTGTLEIRVRERTPVALAMGADGAPAFYLDAEGYALPLVDAAYDRPLLYGLKYRYHPLQPVEQASVRALLAVLGQVPPEVDALLSDFEVEAGGEVWLRTAPVPGRGAIPVRLGRADFAERLRRLEAFWHQAVLPQREKMFSLIDLRFDSQIVTREAPGKAGR